MWGITGVQKEVVLASRRSLVTVEEIVPELTPVAGAVTLPTWTTTYVAPVPGGTYPSYALGYTDRDNRFYQEWDAISRDRDAFTAWISENVLRTTERSEGINRLSEPIREADRRHGRGSRSEARP
jgi:glutaconate CoA-transferase subunit A